MAQINSTVGDLEGNFRIILAYARKAAENGADLVAFPEMAMTGYPPLDLLPPRETRPPSGKRKPEQEDFVRLNKQYVYDLAKEIGSITAVVGFVDYDEANLFNAAAVINQGKVKRVIYKTLLPTYDVFDEQRYFTPALVNTPCENPHPRPRNSLGRFSLRRYLGRGGWVWREGGRRPCRTGRTPRREH